MKKARLDLLEEMPEIELVAEDLQPIEEEVVEVPVEEKKPWAINKLLLILTPVALVVLIICGVVVYFLYTKISEPPRPAVVTKTAPAIVPKPAVKPQVPVETPKAPAVAEVTRTIVVKNFLIDLKDNTGNNRVLMCDVAFDIAEDSEYEKLENSLELRNMIYRAAQRRGAVALKSVEERKKLKKDLAAELDKMAGRAIVKKVYFTNYLIM